MWGETGGGDRPFLLRVGGGDWMQVENELDKEEKGESKKKEEVYI